MRLKPSLYLSVAAIGGAVLLSAPSMQLRAQQDAPASVSIGDSDLGGVVTGAERAGGRRLGDRRDHRSSDQVRQDRRHRRPGPLRHARSAEGELQRLGARLRARRLAEGRDARPARSLNLSAVPAPNAAAAAEYYPAIYWYSMLKVPDKSEFPGTGPQGNGMPANIKSQAQWLDVVKTNGCYACHQLGNKATRTIPKEFGDIETRRRPGSGASSPGRRMTQMANAIGRLDAPRALKLFADWTDRIAAGELPAAKPPRPQGVERNVVLTLWDWADPKVYLHDEIATDKRNPDGQRQRQDLRRDRGEHRFLPGARSGDAHGDRRSRCRCAIRRRRRRRTIRWRRRPTGATSRSGTARPACTIR